MPQIIDWERLNKLFLERGERVVLVPPQGEPLVLVPLSQYEQLLGKGHAVSAETRSKPPARRPAAPTTPATPPSEASSALEPIDPPQGALQDDDQYFPEPL